MSEVVAVVDGILTAILQWRVSWLDEQKNNIQPPPICRAQPKKLKITYENYKDYETTFMPLLMQEIWAQIFQEWSSIETEIRCGVPMDVEGQTAHLGNSILNTLPNCGPRRANTGLQRQLDVGVVEYASEGKFQISIKCQRVVESNKLQSQLKVIGEGDLIRIDLATIPSTDSERGTPSEFIVDPNRNVAILSLFAYVNDVSSERINQYTQLSDCFDSERRRFRNHHVVNCSVVIAKRPLKLKLDEPMKIWNLYYLKPMIRQLESVAILSQSPLSSDILSPKHITCQLTIPTVVSVKSPHYNDMQYKAIVGANEAMVRSIPKIQLIQGPPGTGKTHTLIGIIKHFYSNIRDPIRTPKILICAPSNGAIDEVARRLYKVRDFSKRAMIKRSLRLVRVGHPDQISESVRTISLEELVEANARNKLEALKQKQSLVVKQLEEELSKCDTEIANLRYSNKSYKIPDVEAKIARLLQELDAKKASDELSAKREVSEASRRNMRYELVKNADVILTTLNSCQRQPLESLFKGDRAELSFHCVIVDEASQCVEPELLMPLCYGISRMILIGDPMQLPATVISKHAEQYDFGRSLFERFFIHFGKYCPSSPIAMLTEQYRMHPEICHFPSKQFYDNRLITSRRITQIYPLKPYIMFDLRHGSQSKSSKNSMENEVEAALVKNLLLAVLTKAPENSTVGVITPYKGQMRLITNKIASLQSQRHIKVDVNTCDGFQGQEKDIIILSCVRVFDSKSSIGFLKSYQRVNVALTRAKHSLIVCLSGKSASKDKTWQALVDDANQRHCIQTLTRTPSTISLEAMISFDNQSQPSGSRGRGQKNGSSVSTEYINDIYVPEPLPMDID